MAVPGRRVFGITFVALAVIGALCFFNIPSPVDRLFWHIGKAQLLSQFTAKLHKKAVWRIGFESIGQAVIEIYNNAMVTCAFPNATNATIRIAMIRIKDFDGRMMDQMEPDFLFVIPSEIATADFVNTKPTAAKLCLMAFELESYSWLNAIGGQHSNMSERPICNVIKADWSLYQRHDYGTFSSGGHQESCAFLNMTHLGNCFSCTVLPNNFLLRTSALRSFLKSTGATYERYGEGLHLSLMLFLNGTSAYCPDVSLTEHDLSTVEDYTCNGLGTRWDQRFVYSYELLDAYRIVKPNGEEAWLNCGFSYSIIQNQLPCACSSWLFRILQDLVRIFKEKYQMDYRLVFGTALGAVRDNDIIPWTPDVDIVLVMSDAEYHRFTSHYYATIIDYSDLVYDSEAIDGDHHFAPIRFIPRCPVILDQQSRTPSSTMIEVAKEFNTTAFRNALSSWRNIPYGDIYTPGHLQRWRAQDVINAQSPTKFDHGTIRNISFNLILNVKDHLEGAFGKNWSVHPQGYTTFTGRYEGND